MKKVVGKSQSTTGDEGPCLMSNIRKPVKYKQDSFGFICTNQARYVLPKGEYRAVPKLLILPSWVSYTSPPSCLEGR